MWRFRISGLILLLVAFSALQMVFAAGDDYFESQAIQIGGRLIAVAEADLYRDRGEELLLFLESDEGEHTLQILTQGLSRKYSTTPIAEVSLPESIFGRQVIDFDQDGREDLLLLAMDGLYQVKLGETAGTDTLLRLAEFPPLYSIPEPGTIVPLEMVYDLDGDGVFELLLPCWQGVRLFKLDGDKYDTLHQFHIRQRSGMPFNRSQLKSVGGDGMSFRMARVAVHDLNTDRILDVYVETAGGLAVFYQTGQLQFADQPDKEIAVRGSYRKNLLHASSAFGDINGDGLLDFCRVFTQGIDYDVKSLVEIFLGNIQNGYSQRPTKRIVLEEFAVGLTLVDLDGDGSFSVVVATQSLSTISMVKSLMVKRIPLELKIFSSVAGVIDDEPTAVKQVSCGLELLRQQFPGRFIGCLNADLDSDLRKDLAVVNHDDELEVYLGDSGSVFADKPSASMNLIFPRWIDSADLDGDRRSDLIVCGSDEDGREVVTIIWPR